MISSRRLAIVGCAFISAVASTTTASADYTSTSTLLPAPQYDHTVPPRKAYPVGAQPITLDSFFDVFPDFQRKPGPLPGTQRIDSFFDIFTELSLDNGGGPQTYRADAQMAIRTSADATPPPGTAAYDTEMLQLDLAGGTLPPGMMIRESPTLASMGRTTITDLGGGLYHIDSFFDVFTELSLDGGQSWTPGDNPMHLNGSPEPGTLCLLGLGSLGMLFVRRRGAHLAA
jgi:hypothetical protein